MTELSSFLEDRRLNAALAWLLIAVLAVFAAESALDADYVWSGLIGVLIVVSLWPPAIYEDATVMVPWETLLLAAVPVLARSIELLNSLFSMTGLAFWSYVTVAVIALLIAVEFHLFTPVKMSARFAVVFVLITTLAVAGGWAVVQWLSDLYLRTAFLTTNEALMHRFLAALAAGGCSGILFDAYFRRVRDQRLRTAFDEVIQ